LIATIGTGIIEGSKSLVVDNERMSSDHQSWPVISAVCFFQLFDTVIMACKKSVPLNPKILFWRKKIEVEMANSGLPVLGNGC